MASSESENPNTEASNAKALIFSYSNRTWRAFLSLFPSPDSSFLAKISKYYLQSPSVGFGRRRSGLPLLLHTSTIYSSPVAAEASRIFVILEDIREHTLSNLHRIHKSLAFWQARAVETDYQKVWFMVFNRGPRAFMYESFQIIRRLATDGHPFQSIAYSAADIISLKITILTTLQRCLATFLAQVYLEVNKFSELLTADQEKSLLSLLVDIDNLFCKLEVSISHPCEIYNENNDSLSMESGNSCELHFEKLPNMEDEQTQWTDTEIRDSTSLIRRNLQRLDSYLSFMLSSCQKPNRITLYWLRYTCGAVGLSACSFWVLRHSSLMGSSDIDNWIRTAKESTTTFWEEHVEQPLISIRDELFETFRKRHKGVMEMEEVQLTANSLHRMLLAFSEQTKGQKIPENLTDQEMMEIVMSRYEKEVMHPLQNLIGGELARAMLIQIQKLKLDLETAMLELDQILKANEINFAVLAALPAFIISLLLLYLIRTWVLQDKGAEGRGKIARIKRRLLLVEVEEWIMQFQTSMEQGMEEEAGWIFGMMLYSLDLLCKAVEKNAKETRSGWILLS
ncbi:protein DGS1, mitochondrial isoform X2 [Phalaenopsis equestris]|uniref:protein DGS1, mitochondrial isoform X2 n=1 Tax=Phalaenopsis equestris TaxID=78828 RepID=UPI0009E1F6AD|nr:protein DGS1, mitochondrial isoform X2 [Phalaenopsis equestris]